MSVIHMFNLEGKVALVTGGAGLYGKQIVQALAEAGAVTIMASRHTGTLDALAHVLRDKGLRIETESLDQGSEESVLALRDRLTKRHDTVDILVNNAVLRTMRDWTSPAKAFTESMHTNATGVFLMTRAFGEVMARQGRGSVINIGSIQGMIGPDLGLYDNVDISPPPDYFVHKGGMLQLTRYAAAWLGPRGVRVNCVSPGGFFNGQDDRFVSRYNARTFLGRMANDEDLKGVIVFLASDASAYVTGANIPLDGGYTAM